MSFFGIGLHVIVALFFAVHVIRSGRELYWLLILFMFPLLGSVVYFFAIFLPELRSSRSLQRGLSQSYHAVVSNLDPGRELREAKAAFELTPTAKNQWRYANALLEAGQLAEAVQQYDLCLQGPSANDLDIQFAAANAHWQFQQPEKALQQLLAIREKNPSFRAEMVTFMLARIYAVQGNKDAARSEFEQVVSRFGSVEARAEYAIWAAENGDMATARHLHAELGEIKKHWDKSTNAQYLPLMTKLESAIENS